MFIYESIQIQYVRGRGQAILKMWDSRDKSGKWVELRGRPGYETNGYNARDPLHKAIDALGKAANISDLMNSKVVSINPNHPHGKKALSVLDKLMTEQYNLTEDAKGDALLSFLRGEGGIERTGAKITDIARWNTGKLEKQHDYIQWLFPTTTKSMYNPNAPTLTPELVKAIKSDSKAMNNLKLAQKIMMKFFLSTDVWLKRSDHNHARISRIMENIKLFFGRDDAEDYYWDLMIDAREAHGKDPFGVIAHSHLKKMADMGGFKDYK